MISSANHSIFLGERCVASVYRQSKHRDEYKIRLGQLLNRSLDKISITSDSRTGRTGRDMTGCKWVPKGASGRMPERAIVGGRDVDGCTIYVGRAHHEGDMIPAKVIPEKDVAYVCHNGEEHAKYDYEVLCPAEFGWEFASNGHVPGHAVEAGYTDSGETLYVGRTFHNGSQTVGKIQPSHNCLYIAFDGEELSFKDYEVLVLN